MRNIAHVSKSAHVSFKTATQKPLHSVFHKFHLHHIISKTLPKSKTLNSKMPSFPSPTRPIMHAKTDSDATTSVDGASSPPRRPLYYVESPSAEMEKFSLHSSPIYSPNPLPSNHRGGYHRRSPIHHSRESSTSRFSYASLKQSYANGVGWWPMRRAVDVGETKIGEDGDDDLYERDSNRKVRIVSLLVVGSLIALTIVSLILWGVSKSYRPRVTVQNVVFESFDVHAGVDETGVATEMVSLNSSVAITYVNRGPFFGVGVSSTPWEFYCYQLGVASGEMEKFYVGRKGTRTVVTLVQGHQVPVYGAVTAIRGVIKGNSTFTLPLNLTLALHSEAYILGKLVRSNFYNQVQCPITLKRNQLGTKLKVSNCIYQ